MLAPPWLCRHDRWPRHQAPTTNAKRSGSGRLVTLSPSHKRAKRDLLCSRIVVRGPGGTGGEVEIALMACAVQIFQIQAEAGCQGVIPARRETAFRALRN